MALRSFPSPPSSSTTLMWVSTINRPNIGNYFYLVNSWYVMWKRKCHRELLRCGYSLNSVWWWFNGWSSSLWNVAIVPRSGFSYTLQGYFGSAVGEEPVPHITTRWSGTIDGEVGGSYPPFTVHWLFFPSSSFILDNSTHVLASQGRVVLECKLESSKDRERERKRARGEIGGVNFQLIPPFYLPFMMRVLLHFGSPAVSCFKKRDCETVSHSCR